MQCGFQLLLYPAGLLEKMQIIRDYFQHIFHRFSLTLLRMFIFAVMNNAINTSGTLIYFDLLFQQCYGYVLCRHQWEAARAVVWRVFTHFW